MQIALRNIARNKRARIDEIDQRCASTVRISLALARDSDHRAVHNDVTCAWRVLIDQLPALLGHFLAQDNVARVGGYTSDILFKIAEASLRGMSRDRASLQIAARGRAIASAAYRSRHCNPRFIEAPEKGLLTPPEAAAISTVKLTMGESDHEIDLRFPRCRASRRGGARALDGMQFSTQRRAAGTARGSARSARARRPDSHHGLRAGSDDQRLPGRPRRHHCLAAGGPYPDRRDGDGGRGGRDRQEAEPRHRR